MEVHCGYDFQNVPVFIGYVSAVQQKTPFVIECEDQMWLLKRVSYTKSFKKVSLKELVDFLISKLDDKPKVNVTVDIDLKNFIIDNATGTQVLEELKKGYGINSFFRDGELYVGFSYNSQASEKYRKTKEIIFQKQVIEDDLVYRSKEETKVKVKVTVGEGKTKKEVEIGDPDGQEITFKVPDGAIPNPKKYAEEMLEKHKYEGFSGSFTTFGFPHFRHGDVCKLVDLQHPEKNGSYIVKTVERSFGSGGFRQTIELAQKIS
ncbi:hypothetical protein [Rufibacter ruber]|uniref:hypothetical protein n=1 Tax=Rufibacter ruber TaxID=1783499 RepID=UPI0012900303|nr:hypothetical protein [Rufibacter ruber]